VFHNYNKYDYGIEDYQNINKLVQEYSNLINNKNGREIAKTNSFKYLLRTGHS